MSELPPHIEPGTNTRIIKWGCGDYHDSNNKHTQGPFKCLTGCGRNKNTGEDMVCDKHPREETRSCFHHTGLHILATAGWRQLEKNPAGWKLFTTTYGSPYEMDRWIIWNMEAREENLAKMEDRKLAELFKKLLDKVDEGLRYMVTTYVRKTPFLKDERLLLEWPPHVIHKWYKDAKAGPEQGLPNVAQHPHMN